MNGRPPSDTEIYKSTYKELVEWVKELSARRRADEQVYERNLRQARIIMSLEFELRKHSYIMVEDKQETAVKNYGVAESDVVSLDEYRSLRLKRRGGGGPTRDGDWFSDMIWGTEFLVRPKVQKTWMLAKFMMGGLKEGMGLVIPMRGDEPVQDDKEWMWVDPVEFCKYWELMAVILVPKEIEDGNLDAD